MKVLVSRSDEPIAGAQVTATFRFAEAGTQTPLQTVTLAQTAVGVYAGTTDAIKVPGTWVVTVKVEGVGETVPRLRYRVHVAPP